MENHPDNANQGDPPQNLNAAAQGDPNPAGQGQHVPHLENQAIRAEMDAIRSQLSEVIRVISALRDVGPIEPTAVVEVNHPPPPPGGGISQALRNVQWPPYGLPLGYTPLTAGANPEGGPLGTTNQAQPDPAGHDIGTATPRVQIQIPVSAAAPGTPVDLDSPATVHPQVQGTVPQVGAHPRDPHVAPAMVSMNNPHYGVSGFPLNYPDETKNQYQMLEERLRAVEGSSSQARNAHELCLVPNLVLPPKFKPPTFDKYKGATCPRSHVTMYCRKMTAYARDDGLMMHCFQESLAGAPLEWYMKLEPTYIRCWKDLADAFIRQYQYNSDLAPDRTQLQCMTKRENESFKEYAQRWRALAAQVTPPLLDKELVSMFMETLPPPYYDRLVSSAASTFSDAVITGERIENGMRSGRIAYGSAPPPQQKKSFSGPHKKKEGETNAIISASGPSHAKSPQAIPIPPQAPPAQVARPFQSNNQFRNYNERKTVVFDPIPMSYTDLFNYLIANNVISTRQMKPYQPPYPRGYDANATCAFHSGAVGHVVENCKAFKYVVQDLLDAKSISFQQPNVTTNPLPGHGGPVVNAIDVQGGQSLIRRVENIKTPLSFIHAMLCRYGIIREGCTRKDICNDASCVGACESFKPILQDLLDRHVVQIGVQDKKGSVCTLQSNNRGFRRTFEVPYDLNSSPAAARPPTMVIPVPAAIPSRETRVIPWSCNVQKQVEIPQKAVDVTNIAGSSGITRSGRLYAPENLRGERVKEAQERARKGKETVEVREVSDKEAQEFLRVMRQSEYRVVDQLNQTPAKISMLSLLLSSEAHRAALLKILNEAHVSHDITVNQLDGIVGNIVASNYLTFTDAELPPTGKSHNQALHISVKVGDYILARVLIDNGSSLNVLPKSTMDKLNVDCSYLKPSSTLVRAFDGSVKEVFGEVEMPLQVGPEVFYVTFQVMDINSSYSCLLGRPWIHSAGAVPSSLHQKLKFIAEGKLIVVSGEEETLINKSPPEYYVESAEESFETAFQGLEISNAVFLERESPQKSKWSKADLAVAKMMLGSGYQVGKGLGKNAQGIVVPVQLKGNPERFGVGYMPSLADHERLAVSRRENQGRSLGQKKMIIGDIKKSFVSAGVLYPDQVNAIEEGTSLRGDATSLVRYCATGEGLQNWETMDFPVIFNLE